MAEGKRRRPRRGRAVETLIGDVAPGALRLTVVGSSCSIPRPGRACSSYLVEAAQSAIVADLGSGAFGNLRRYREPETIGAVVITHMHADHFLDIIPMRYALKYGHRTTDIRVPLYVPPGGAAMLRKLVGAFAPEASDDFLGDVFDVRTYEPHATLEVGDVRVRFAPTSHYIETFALRFESDAASLTYSADTSPDERVVVLAHASDAFLCEATLTEAGEAERPRGHSSAREAAAMAFRAEAARLLLTHYPASADVGALENVARAGFSGPVDVVDDGFAIVLTGSR